MMSLTDREIAERKKFVNDNCEEFDNDFLENLKRTGWLVDPLVQELVRRLKNLPERVFLTDLGHMQRADRLEKQLEECRAASKAALADVFAAESAQRHSRQQRRGPASKYLPDLLRQLQMYGPYEKSRLIDAVEKLHPGKRSAIGNALRRELEKKGGAVIERSGQVRMQVN